LPSCIQCNTPLRGTMLNSPGLIPCPGCGVLMQAAIFPALFRNSAPGASGESLTTDDDASCFYHTGKKAVIPCDACGRFLCALCDVAFNDQHLCPSCLEKGTRKCKIKNLENHRILYDRLAFYLAIIPMLFIFPSIITSPMALFITIRHWKSPGSIVQHSRVRFVLAAILASLQIIGWLAVLYFGIIH